MMSSTSSSSLLNPAATSPTSSSSSASASSGTVTALPRASANPGGLGLSKVEETARGEDPNKSSGGENADDQEKEPTLFRQSSGKASRSQSLMRKRNYSVIRDNRTASIRTPLTNNLFDQNGHDLSGSGGAAQIEDNQQPSANANDPENAVVSAPSEEDELVFTLPEFDKEHPDEASTNGKTVQECWPVDHVMVLYMLSRYAVCARTAQDKETWIRQIPLLVLMYEGIAAGVLNFDYAPAPIFIAQEGTSRRIWMNVTQDGKSAIDDMREAHLINGLKLSTRDFHSVTAFQVSQRGLVLLEQLSKDIKARVDSFIFAPKPYRHELLKIKFIPIQDKPDEEDVVDQPLDMIMSSMSTPSASSAALTGVPTAATSTATTAVSVAGATATATQDQKEKEAEFNEEGRFMLLSFGYFRYSEVTETEDVSYVSSPFIPQSVRGNEIYQQLTSNRHRAGESATGQSNIRDELSEAITLCNPVCIVGEWIPFGSNQIVALNERFGSMDRCQGGLFTSLIDDRPTNTQFEVPPGLTQVRIMEYDPVRFINFEAEINFPEEDGIVQVEHFGIHLNVDGTIFYGIRVESILDKQRDRLSIDLLARLLVDIHQDSSEIMDDLLSSYQNSLLDMVFLGDIENRGKFNMILAEQIDPFMAGVDYMDRGDYENELKQVLGDIHCAYDIGEDSVMIVGREGMLIAGPASRKFERIFVGYLSLLCREMFLRSFFTRIFILDERLKRVRRLILNANEDPNHVFTIRNMLNEVSNDLILFADTLGYLIESLEFVKLPTKNASRHSLTDVDGTGATNGSGRTSPRPDTKFSMEEDEIYSYLELNKQHHDILLRARDLEKLVHGAKYELVNLRQMAEVLNTSQLEEIFKAVETNTKNLADSSELYESQTGFSFELMQLLLAGSFALTLVDRLTGGKNLNVTPLPKWVDDWITQPIVQVPFLFFGLNLVWMLLCLVALSWFSGFKRRQREGMMTLRIKINKEIDIDHFQEFLGSRQVQRQESVSQVASELRRVMWQETPDKHKWGFVDTAAPLIDVEYDSRFGFLLYVTFHCRHVMGIDNKPKAQVAPTKRFDLLALFPTPRPPGETGAAGGLGGRGVLTPRTKSELEAALQNDLQKEVEIKLLRTFAEDLKAFQVIPKVEHLL